MLQESEFRLAQMGRKGLAKVLAGVREDLREDLRAQGIEDFPFPVQSEARTPRSTVAQRPRRESLPTPEQLVLRPRFTDQEREKLLGDDAKIYLLSGTTILQQRDAQEAKGKPSFGYITDGGDRLLARSSRKDTEVAFFPAPPRFFVEGTFGKDTDTQERLVRATGQALSEKLGLPNIAGILADEAATWSDLTFQYLGDPDGGEWLFGPKYAEAVGKTYVYGRTKNSTNASGSRVAYVGYARPEGGLGVFDWSRDDGHDSVGAPLLVVPIENR